ncbi:MAG: alpha-amylase, partial [Acidobacteriaceae bacterium]|nr:alpha-amylase [Acidobacteriaceae bacterium]
KNTLEFDPEVLKRYVNFMNNPDERTAVDQFGKGDKYFGVCTMMATLPGLPMFGHGQVEGYTERYGMEYKRAYYDEQPDTWLVARHEREISPLLHRRAQFAEVSDFLLYDLFTDYGTVNEDVYAYSNRHGTERALVVYHNRYGHTSGWIRASCGFVEKTADGGKRLAQRTLADSFNLSRDGSMYVAFRDSVTALEYLHRACDIAEKGMRLELGAYKYHVFLDWRDLRDDGARPWGALCDQLAGRGVSSLDDALRNLELAPVCAALRSLLEVEVVEEFAAIVRDGRDGAGSAAEQAIDNAAGRVRVLLEETARFVQSAGADPLGVRRKELGDVDDAVTLFRTRLSAAVNVPALEKYFSEEWSAQAACVLPGKACETAAAVWGTVIAFCALEALAQVYDPADALRSVAHLFDALRLRETFAERFAALGLGDEERWKAAARLRAAFAHAPWAAGAETITGRSTALFSWLHDQDVAWLIGVHEHEGIRYFVREPFERLQWWMALRALIGLASAPRPDREAIRALEEEIQARMRAAGDARYQVEALFESGRERHPTKLSS